MQQWLRNISSIAVGGALLVTASFATFPSTAHAGQLDSDGFIEQFAGNLVLNYAQGDPATGLYANHQLPVVAPSLEKTFDDQWAGLSANFCSQLQAQIKPDKWTACVLPSVGELRAKQLGTNSIGLKYIVAHNHLNFEYPLPDPCPAATVDVYFDVELDATLNFASSVDGAAWPPARPLSVPSATLKLQNAQINTSNFCANVADAITGVIGQEAAALNKTSYNASTLVQGPVADSNRLLDGAAAQLGQTIRTGNAQLNIQADPNSNEFFNLDVNLDPNGPSGGSVVVTFRRDYFPPATPTNLQAKTQYPQSYSYLVTWNEAMTKSRPVLYYRVQWSDPYIPGAQSGDVTTQATSYQAFTQFVALDDSTPEYQWTVTAVNLYGQGAAVRVMPPPPPPTGGGGGIPHPCGVSAQNGGTGLPCPM
jgi:hypothetical protein